MPYGWCCGNWHKIEPTLSRCAEPKKMKSQWAPSLRGISSSSFSLLRDYLFRLRSCAIGAPLLQLFQSPKYTVTIDSKFGIHGQWHILKLYCLRISAVVRIKVNATAVNSSVRFPLFFSCVSRAIRWLFRENKQFLPFNCKRHFGNMMPPSHVADVWGYGLPSMANYERHHNLVRPALTIIGFCWLKPLGIRGEIVCRVVPTVYWIDVIGGTRITSFKANICDCAVCHENYGQIFVILVLRAHTLTISCRANFIYDPPNNQRSRKRSQSERSEKNK